ncbi:MAG: hypothetical protein V2A79_12005 [Planctomycetota bacterium]
MNCAVCEKHLPTMVLIGLVGWLLVVSHGCHTYTGGCGEPDTCVLFPSYPGEGAEPDTCVLSPSCQSLWTENEDVLPPQIEGAIASGDQQAVNRYYCQWHTNWVLIDEQDCFCTTPQEDAASVAMYQALGYASAEDWLNDERMVRDLICAAAAETDQTGAAGDGSAWISFRATGEPPGR